MERNKDTEKAIAEHFAAILHLCGCDFEHDVSMADTPLRTARGLLEMIEPEPFDLSIFQEKLSCGVIFQNGIFVHSLCKHHLLPFFGTACIAILPGASNYVIGLSKFARLARYHAAGFRTQEEITSRIGHSLMENQELKLAGVGVSLRMYHCCMSLRGVGDCNAVTTTQYLGGLIQTDAALRAEVMSCVRHPDVMR